MQLGTNSSVILLCNCCTFNLIDKSALRVRQHRNTHRMGIAFDGYVLEINPVGRKKNKDQDERNHYIIMDAAAFVGPKNVAANCSPDGVHRQRRSARYAGYFGSV